MVENKKMSRKAARKMCSNTDRMNVCQNQLPLRSILWRSYYSLLSVSLGGANDTSVHLPTLSPFPSSFLPLSRSLCPFIVNHFDSLAWHS